MTLNSAPFKIRKLFNLNRYGVEPLNLCLCVVSFPAAVGKLRRFRLSLEMFTTEHRLQTDLQFMQRCTFLIGVYYWTKTSGHLNNGKGRALLSNQRVISTFSTWGENVCTSRRTSLERTMHQPALLSATPHIGYIYVPRHRWKEAMWQKRKLKDGLYVQPRSITAASLPGMFNLSCINVYKFTNSWFKVCDARSFLQQVRVRCGEIYWLTQDISTDCCNFRLLLLLRRPLLPPGSSRLRFQPARASVRSYTRFWLWWMHRKRLESSWFSFTVMWFYSTPLHTHTESGGGFVSASPQRSSLSLNPPAVTCDPGQLDSWLCCFHNRSLSSVHKHPDP